MKRLGSLTLPVRLAVALVLLLSLSAVSGRSLGVLHASTPPGGSIDGSTPTSWDFGAVGGATVVSNVSGPVASACAPGLCDNYDLTVILPQAASTYYQTMTATLTIKYTWTSTVPTDLDLFAFSPSGSSHGPGSPDATSTGAGEEDLVITDPLDGVWHIRSVASLTPVPTAAHAVATLTFAPRPAPTTYAPLPTDPSFLNYNAPSTILQKSGEPSIGPDWSKNGTAMYTGAGCATCSPTTARVDFNDAVSPATATWTDVSPTGENKVTTDPIGFMAHSSAGNRWFTSQLSGPCSITSFTDNNGANWTPSEGCGPPAGVDHQTIGGGPYSASVAKPALATYPAAIYYCSQDLVTAFCSRSDNGGLTFGPPISIYNLTTCPAGIHGHVKVGPDGTVYVPNRDCLGSDGKNHPGVAVSHDNGQTWTVSTVNDGAPKGQGSDPSVGIGADNTVYLGYQNIDGHALIAVSHDEGQSWSKSTDAGLPYGTQNMEFAGVVAGDGNRAAFTYLGTDTPGDDQSADFTGTWHLYVAYTYDAGATWTTVDATPNDPVQRGCVWDGGGSNQCRNMSDFNDIQIDKTGRVYIAYTDGCSGACETDPNAAVAPSGGQGKYSRIAAIVRQVGGMGLLSQYDGTNFGGGASGNDTCFGNGKGISKHSGSHCHVHIK
ncbi:MAG: hypothetical protein PVSMB7_08570 [Chloroflexota bacterium]